MPDLELRYPEGLFTDAEAKNEFLTSVAECVAGVLTCLDYDGETCVELKPGDIDVVMVPYLPENARLSAPLVGKLAGYDYPDRMARINESLRQLVAFIGNAAGAYGNRSYLPEGRQWVSLSFFPMQKGTWV